MNHPARRDLHSGSFLAAAAIIVALMLIGGLTLMTSAGGDFSQHAMTLYSSRATLYARAALAETGLVLRRKLATAKGRDELAGGSWETVVDQIRTATANDPEAAASGEVHSLEITDMLSRAPEMVEEGGAVLTRVQLSLRGFRRLATSHPGSDLTEENEFYYSQVLDPNGKPADPPPEDYSGYAVITAVVNFNGPRVWLTRELNCQQVIKVSSSAPVAREFVLFAWGDTGSAPETEQMEFDLNEGGSLLLFGARSGRINLRGPYSVETRGYSPPFCHDDPTIPTAGGPVPNPAYAPGFLPPDAVTPDLRSSYPYEWVHGWATLPAPRAGVLDLCGPAIGRAFMAARPQVRPQRWAILGAPSCPPPVTNFGEFLQALGTGLGDLLAGVGALAICLGDIVLFPIDLLNNCWTQQADIGQQILPNQWWFTETLPLQYSKAIGPAGEVDAPDYFSIVGATVPDSNGRRRVSPYRGVLAKDRPNDTTLMETLGAFEQSADKSGRMARPDEIGGSNSEKYMVLTEGFGSILFHRATKCEGLCDNVYSLAVDKDGGPDNACGSQSFPQDRDLLAKYTMPLGLYWAPFEEPDRYAIIQADFFAIITGVLSMGVAVKGFSAKLWKELLGGAIVGGLIGAIGDDVANAWNNNPTGSVGVDGSSASGDYRFPPGYRLPSKTAIRRFATLAEYPGLYTHDRNPDEAPEPDYDVLVLDGPIFVERLAHDKPILYTGRGSIITEDTDEPYLTAPIVSFDMVGEEFSPGPLGSPGERRSDYFGVLTEPYEDYAVPGKDADSLTIFLRGDLEEPWSRDGMLQIRQQDSFGFSFGYESPVPIHASVVSLHGVRPAEAGQALRIVGNMVCYFPNRRHIPKGSKVEVHYRPAPEGRTGDLVALSPVWSAYDGESP